MAIQKIFVVGAGLMGSGIAQNAICSGYDVTLNDQRQEALERAQVGIQKALEREVEKGRMTQEAMDAALPHLSLDITLEGAKEADLVIEAVFENLEAKQAVFQQLEEVCPPNTIFASNTSSISLTALAAATKRPSRVVGMHFFSPVPKMRLCEVIFGLLTDQEVLHEIKIVGEKMGKTLIRRQARIYRQPRPAAHAQRGLRHRGLQHRQRGGHGQRYEAGLQPPHGSPGAG